MDFSKIDSILEAFNKILKLDSIGKTPPVPAPLILVGAENKPGLSSTKIASRIIARKSEAGIPIGTLPSGEVSPDDIMIRIIVEEIVKALIEDSKITITTSMGQAITAAGTSAAGPVAVYGSTITLGNGYGVIQ